MLVLQAWRSWRHAKAVAFLAAAAFAAGIGAATAIYTVVNAVMLKPLPYRDGDRFVVILSAEVIDLHPGDVVVAFTDGVTDALNPEGEEFGEERLKEVLRGAVGAPADRISTGLSAAMRDWIGDAEQHDDLTFVVVAVNTTKGQHTE